MACKQTTATWPHSFKTCFISNRMRGESCNVRLPSFSPAMMRRGAYSLGDVLNQALQGYKRNLLENLTEKIVNRDQMVQRFRGDDILVVVSDSGTGKTFLLARTVALLLNKRRGGAQQDLVPNLAFSQLKSRQHKHQRHNNLVDAVLSSTHLSSVPNDIDAFGRGWVERIQPGHQPTVPDIIMFIDSWMRLRKLQWQFMRPIADFVKRHFADLGDEKAGFAP